MAATAQAPLIERARGWLALLPVRFDDRRFWGRAALAGLLRAAALAAPWSTLRSLVTSAAVASLQLLGVEAVRLDEALLFAGERVVNISVSCTHVEVFALMAPLLWDRSKSASRNVLQLALVGLAVTLLGVARIDLAIVLSALGVPWALAHDVALGVFYALLLGSTLSRNAWTRGPTRDR